MNFHFISLTNDEKSGGKKSKSRGILRIEVPHWSAQVRIFDGTFKPVKVEKIKADPDSLSGYSTEMSLRAGVYKIKTSLEGKTESEWVPVRPNYLTKLTTDAWNNLEFTSATPLEHINNADEAQVRAAREMSSKLIWKDSSGDSGLFLFIRAVNPQKNCKTFTKGLRLFDEKGRLVTDFSENVEKNENEGWLAFNANLPAGGYILRRGRSGVNIRNQVVYLCSNWQTEIFIQARLYPSLATSNVGMKPNRNFSSNAEAAEAAEAVLNFLRYKTDIRGLFNSDKMINNLDILLDEKFDYPWFGIVSAHAILRLEEKFGGASGGEKNRQQIKLFREYFKLLRKKLIPFLKREIPSHPDVKALSIEKGSKRLEFSFPPMLWQSLRRVQSYSTAHVGIIPKNSLTDCIIDNPLDDSPWTAWSKLTRYPENFEESENSEKTTVKAFPVVKPKRSRSFLSETIFQRRAAQINALPQFQSDEPPNLTLDQKVLQQASITQTAKSVMREYVEAGKVEEIPEIFELNSSEQINQMLGQVSAQDISAACNVPLSRTESELESLKKQGETLAAAGHSSDVSAPQNNVSETPLGMAIIDFAVNPTTSQVEAPAVAGQGSFEPRIFDNPSTSIENLVSQIRAAAERLWLAETETAEENSASANDSGISCNAEELSPLTVDERQFARDLAEDLKAVSENLLSCADFIVVTDAQHKIFDKNDAFLFLLLPPQLGALSPDALIGDLYLKQAKWEAALAPLTVGKNVVNDPLADKDSASSFSVTRTLIEDKQSNLQAYLNVLRKKDSRVIAPETLNEISQTLSDLTLYTSLFVYETSSGKNEYNEKLVEIREQIKSLIKG
jgi:hypothetical protein